MFTVLGKKISFWKRRGGGETYCFWKIGIPFINITEYHIMNAASVTGAFNHILYLSI